MFIIGTGYFMIFLILPDQIKIKRFILQLQNLNLIP